MQLLNVRTRTEMVQYHHFCHKHCRHGCYSSYLLDKNIWPYIFLKSKETRKKLKHINNCLFKDFNSYLSSFYIKKNYLCIYSSWLPWVSYAARGLCLVAVSRVYSLCCAGFSLQWLLLLQSMALGTPAQHLWHMGFLAPLHVESSWTRNGTCVPCIDR